MVEVGELGGGKILCRRSNFISPLTSVFPIHSLSCSDNMENTAQSYINI